MPTPAQVSSKRTGSELHADKKDPTGSRSKRRPQGGQGSDTDSGIYQVKSHMIVQRRQPPPKFNRTARDTYFDKVLNNSDDSYEESTDNDDKCYDEDDAASFRGRPTGRQPAKSTRDASFQRNRQQKPHSKPEVSDRLQNTKALKQAGPRQAQRDGRRELPRTKRELEYPDFDSNEDEYDSEISVDAKPRRRSVISYRKKT
ncbi:hypothetical protein ACTXT7_007049 [Hymenolepis weldensis]